MNSLLQIRTSLILLTLMLAACQPAPEERYERAQAYFSDAEYRAAAIELRNALQSRPEYPEARFLLGRVSYQLADFATAQSELERALSQGLDTLEVWTELGRAILAQGDAEAVIARVDPNIERASADSRALTMLGNSYLRLGNFNEATALFALALEREPNNPEAVVGRALVAAAEGDNKSAESILKSGLEANPDSEILWRAMATLLASEAQHAEAIDAFENAIRSEANTTPLADRMTTRIYHVSTLIDAQRLDEASTRLNELRSLFSGLPIVDFLEGRLAYSLGDYDRAELALRDYLAAVPNDVRGMALLGAVNFSQSNLNQAESFLSQAVRNNVGGDAANRLLAETRLRLNKPGEALDALSDPDADEGDPALMALYGRAELGRGNTASALGYFEKGAAGVADSPDVGMSIAAGFLAAGQVERAIEVLNEIPTDKDEPYRKEVLLIAAHLTSENNAAALRVAGELLESNADDPTAYSIVASLHQSLGNTEAARTALQEALQIDDGHRPSLLALSRLETGSGNEQRAEQLLKKLLAEDPAYVPGLTVLADLYERQDRLPELNDPLASAIDSDPGALVPRLLLIRALAAAGEETAARQAIEAAKPQFPDEPRLMHAEAMAQVREGNTEAALENLRRAANLLPGNASYQFDLASLSLAEGDTDGALAAIQRFRDARPDSRRGLAMHVSILVRRQNLTEARRQVDRFEVRFSDTSAAIETLKGDIEVARGNHELAASLFEAAAEGGLTRPLAMRLARAYQQSSPESGKGRDALERWLAVDPDDLEARRMLGQILESQGRSEEAVTQYERVLASGADDPVALNNLAWHYLGQGDPRASTMAARAYELMPDNGSVADTYGWTLHLNGQSPEALPLLRKAAALSPNNGEIQYHLAAVLDAVGEKKEASVILDRLLDTNQDFPSRNDAQALAEAL